MYPYYTASAKSKLNSKVTRMASIWTQLLVHISQNSSFNECPNNGNSRLFLGVQCKMNHHLFYIYILKQKEVWMGILVYRMQNFRERMQLMDFLGVQHSLEYTLFRPFARLNEVSQLISAVDNLHNTHTGNSSCHSCTYYVGQHSPCVVHDVSHESREDNLRQEVGGVKCSHVWPCATIGEVALSQTGVKEVELQSREKTRIRMRRGDILNLKPVEWE